jgi:hypothetical protein
LVNGENRSDIPSFVKPGSVNSDENVINDSVKTTDKTQNSVDRNKDKDEYNPAENTIESDQLTREKEQLKAKSNGGNWNEVRTI